jgi:KDO2-lipid IV(A) lauroyltransferase
MISFLLIRLLTLPMAILPYSVIHRIGNVLGLFAYYLMPKFRRRAWSNLALATDLHLDEKEMKRIAKGSFQNLMITLLEYPKFAREKNMANIALCENPETANEIMKAGKGVIFFCGHQANWEILFLEGTSRMPGVAIGRPQKNRFLYDWILTIRQKFGGKIITPKNAIREGLRGLKKGAFLGIVGDQAMPDSGYSSPFFGRRAWTSPIAAILSYRTGTPIMVATTLRKPGKYYIHYSDPIWPNPEAPLDEEVDRMMRASLALLEESIRKAPEQWMWQHNRWKQQVPGRLKRPFRQEAICIILPKDASLYPHLKTFREIYPTEFLTFLVPKGFESAVPLNDVEVLTYEDPNIQDYRFKLVFNFTDFPLRRHFLRLSAFDVFTLEDLRKLSGNENALSLILKRALLTNSFP